jgi:uncharacterized protein
MRIAAIGDIHCRKETSDIISSLLDDIESKADVLVLAGDLTDTGLPEEAEVLARQLSMLSVPIIAILGNHDHQSGKPEEVTQVITEAGIILLDGGVYEIGPVGFIGTKGFAGGFGQNLVQPFGEQALKSFIMAGIDETLILENALAKLTECEKKVAILHYAPVKETLQGEPQELWPFLGTSRLSDVLDRRKVDVIFHGHAHHGSPTGKTESGTPVYNVSRFVQEKHTGVPYCIVEI